MPSGETYLSFDPEAAPFEQGEPRDELARLS